MFYNVKISLTLSPSCWFSLFYRLFNCLLFLSSSLSLYLLSTNCSWEKTKKCLGSPVNSPGIKCTLLKYQMTKTIKYYTFPIILRVLMQNRLLDVMHICIQSFWLALTTLFTLRATALQVSTDHQPNVKRKKKKSSHFSTKMNCI